MGVLELPANYDIHRQVAANAWGKQVEYYWWVLALAAFLFSDELEATYRIVVKDGRLRLERLKSNSSVLEPLVTDTLASQPGVIRFTRDAAGTVTGFELEAGRVRGMNFWKETAQARRLPNQ